MWEGGERAMPTIPSVRVNVSPATWKMDNFCRLGASLVRFNNMFAYRPGDIGMAMTPIEFLGFDRFRSKRHL